MIKFYNAGKQTTLDLSMPEIEIDIKSILPRELSVRIAELLQHKRIFITGDAAHQMPP